MLPDGRVESTGNFHGAPLGFAADFLAIAAAEVGSIAERRVDRLLDVHPLPGPAAVPHPRRRASTPGLMIAQYTAAGIVAENRRLAVARLGRLAADLRHAGGPRLDGLGRGHASCARSWTT